ncbi:MAG TPA: carboxypeptidase-like regulatory domain-containing protein [Pirellulales bacterium]|nr:carboxypeptidase-like regulatory domain-containing protein [Pirellulales bacterium]
MRQFIALLAVTFCTTLQAADTVHVRGLIHEQETDRPVAGAVLLLSDGKAEARVESDANGRYECRLSPGIITGRFVDVPVPLITPLRAFRAPITLGNGEAVSLPPIELRPGIAVRGHVVGADGKPVVGATVQAMWTVFEPWSEGYISGPKWLITRSDEQGKFVFAGIDPVDGPRPAERGPRFWAARGSEATETFVSLPTQPDGPIELRLSRNSVVSVAGGVVDTSGRPIAGARVEVWTQWRTDAGFVLAQVPLFVSLEHEIVTDSEGRYRIPQPLDRKQEYALMATCDGYLPARGTWYQPGDGAAVESPELCLRKLRSVAGRVVDCQGRPLPGTRVFQAGDNVQVTEAMAADEGRFSLTGIAEGPAFLFAERDGYRFCGVDAAQSGDTEIVLARDDEPALPLASLPANVMPHEEELALARRLIEPDVQRALRLGNHQEQWNATYHWRRLNPAEALEQIDNGMIVDLTSDDKDFLRTQIARSLVRDDLTEAETVANAIEDADRRARALFELAASGIDASPDTRRTLLSQSLLAASHAEDPSLRALWQACVADVYLDLGDVDVADRLLAEAGTTAATLPLAGGGGSSRRYIAEVLARTDLATALNLVRDLAEDKDRDRAIGKIAYRVAAKEPAEAERMLTMVGERYHRDWATVRVCYRMATTDSERARRLASQVASPYLRSLALGWIARGCAASDAHRARRILNDAFEQLKSLTLAGESRFYGPQSAAVAATLLLPVVEVVDPQLVREHLWRAVSFRRPYSVSDQEDLLMENAMLALLLARYDRATARLVLEPAAEQFKRRALNETGRCQVAVVYAACAIDPRWCATLAEPPTERRPFRALGWHGDLAWALAIPPAVRTRLLFANLPGNDYWFPGAPDNEFVLEF